MKYNSKKVKGRDYSKPMIEMLEFVIGEGSISKPISRIAAFCGRSDGTTRKLISRLHKTRRVHIKRWTRNDTGKYFACYKLGDGVDAKKPSAMTNAERSRRYRNTPNGAAVCKAARERFEKSDRCKEYKESYNKARWARIKAKTIGLAGIDPLMAAIYGVSNGNHP